jgi:hypothetical protein
MPRTVETPTDNSELRRREGALLGRQLAQGNGVPAAEARFLQTKGLGHHRIVTNAGVITEALGFLEQADLLDSDVPERLDLGA